MASDQNDIIIPLSQVTYQQLRDAIFTINYFSNNKNKSLLDQPIEQPEKFDNSFTLESLTQLIIVLDYLSLNSYINQLWTVYVQKIINRLNEISLLPTNTDLGQFDVKNRIKNLLQHIEQLPLLPHSTFEALKKELLINYQIKWLTVNQLYQEPNILYATTNRECTSMVTFETASSFPTFPVTNTIYVFFYKDINKPEKKQLLKFDISKDFLKETFNDLYKKLII